MQSNRRYARRCYLEPAYLLANPLLMESTGVKVIKLPKKQSLVLAVASTVLKDSSAAGALRAEKVCRVKAFASLVQEQKGVQVFHTEESTEKTVIVNVDGKEHGNERLGNPGNHEDQGPRHRQGHAGRRTLEVQGRRRVLPCHRGHRQQEGRILLRMVTGNNTVVGELARDDSLQHTEEFTKGGYRARNLAGLPDYLRLGVIGSISMGIGIIIALKMFTLSTRKVDEWELIKQGNIAMAIVMASRS